MTQILRPYGRLSLCAEMVREGSRLADIGTDHGYLPIELCLKKKIPSALACDINPLPLRSARENIAKFGLSDKIQTRLSDGLQEVRTDEVDDVVIAGMGGELIRDILCAAPWIKDEKKRLILQPMTHHEDLIQWLYQNGFAVNAQKAALDEGKYYTILSATFDGEEHSADLFSCIIGRLSPSDENSRGFLKRCLQNYRNKSKGDPSLIPVVQQLEEVLREDQ